MLADTVVAAMDMAMGTSTSTIGIMSNAATVSIF
jgi:hypothetical protein